MAAMILAMLFIGVSMVASLGDYHTLVAIHRPLGIMILVLAVIRFLNRMFTTLPPFPPTMSRQERFMASSSEKLLYALMFALPLVGWGMLSAGHYPIVMFGSFHLPPILPANPDALRRAAQDAHHSRLPALSNVSGSSRCRIVPYADCSGSASGPHGRLENPLQQDQESKLMSQVPSCRRARWRAARTLRMPALPGWSRTTGRTQCRQSLRTKSPFAPVGMKQQTVTPNHSLNVQLRVYALALLLFSFGSLATWLRSPTAGISAGVSHTTLGYGDIVLPKPWRSLGPISAINGLLTFGCSTAFLFLILQLIWQHPL